MPRVITVDRHVAEIKIGIGAEALWTTVGGGGLLVADVSSHDFEQVRGLRADAAIGLDDDRSMSPGIHGSVEGAPMDYRGDGTPLPSLRELEPRIRETSELEKDTGEGVLIGVVDTGMRAHPWLEGAYLASPTDFESALTQQGLPTVKSAGAGVQGKHQETGHGTFVTGLILQQAPAASVWAERALDPSGNALTSAVVEAATTLARRGVHILNLSLGCFSDDPASALVMRRLVEDLHRIRPDMVIVAAAGNIDGSNGDPTSPAPFWPAAVDEVVAVGAVDDAWSTDWSDWSNRGSWVDFAAPGHRLLSTYVTGAVQTPDGTKDYDGWARWSGTSFAAAVVSGAIARVMTAKGLNANDAVLELRRGTLSTGQTKAEGSVPSVPVVAARSWDEHLPAQQGAAG